MRPNPDKYTARCWICNTWWIWLILLLLLGAGLVAYRSGWFPFLPMPTLTPEPAPSPTVTVLGTGDVQITLLWAGLNDLDLHVLDPDGKEIYFGARSSPSGGHLDVDSNCGCGENITTTPVENIYWGAGAAPTGTYSVFVVYYAVCAEERPTTPFEVRVLADGQVTEYTGVVDTATKRVEVITLQR